MLRVSIRTFFILAFCALGPAFGQTSVSSTRIASFPPLTFGATETLEVTVANVAANPASTTAAAASCVGSVSFYNATGALIGSATAFTLTSGEAKVATLPFASAGVSGPTAAIRAAISLTPPAAAPRPPCDLVFSLEISDTASGATHAVVTSEAAASSIVLPGR